MAELDPNTERALRARILELEALVEARTQAIVGLGAELAELRRESSPVVAERPSSLWASPPGTVVAAWQPWLTTTRPNGSWPNCRLSCSSQGSSNDA